MTKAAQIYMAKCLTHAVGPRIRINSVSPGLMMTVSAFSKNREYLY